VLNKSWGGGRRGRGFREGFVGRGLVEGYFWRGGVPGRGVPFASWLGPGRGRRAVGALAGGVGVSGGGGAPPLGVWCASPRLLFPRPLGLLVGVGVG